MLRDARQSGTATEALFCEGEATIGVWLPLALADIFAALVCLARPYLENPNSLPVPERSETLQDWLLPMMAKSICADEKERKALAMFNAVKALKERYEKK